MIEGRVTSGSINIDGASAIRRTCSLSLVAKELNINDFYWGLKSKFKLEIGLKNTINSNYPDIIWFKQGIYAITSFSTNQTINNYTVSISGKDKGCFINGEIGGSIPAMVDFGTEEYTNKEKNTTEYIKIPIKKIIREMMHTYALEPYHNIIVNDLDEAGLEMLEYRGDEPLYLLYNVKAQQYMQIKRAVNESEEYYVINKENGSLSTKKLKNLKYLQNIDLVEDKDSDIFYLEDPNINPQSIQYKAVKIEYGQVVGYRITDLTYPGELISGIGEAITSILDKLKNMLGDFEYFYDLDGRFVFQRKKNSMHKIFNGEQKNEGGDYYIDNFAFNDNIIYKFEGGNLISSYQNSPDLQNLKNDFSIWGNRKGISGADLPIHYRYAIDKKPLYYKAFEEKNISGEHGIKYYASEEQALLDYDDSELMTNDIDNGTIIITDWRELIYQMANDYYKYNQNDNFSFYLEKNNIRKGSSVSLYPKGTTGYERYYIDIISFWRELYNPFPKPHYINSSQIDLTSSDFIFTQNFKDIYTDFKYRPFDSSKDKDKNQVKVLYKYNDYKLQEELTAEIFNGNKNQYWIFNKELNIYQQCSNEDEYDEEEKYYIKNQPDYIEVISPQEINFKQYYILSNDSFIEQPIETATNVDKYIEEYYVVPTKTWNQFTWDATNIDILRNNYWIKGYYKINDNSTVTAANVTNYYIKDETTYTQVEINDFYDSDLEYYEYIYKQIPDIENTEEIFNAKGEEKWYYKTGNDTYEEGKTYQAGYIYYRYILEKVINPQIDFKNKKLNYLTKNLDSYSPATNYDNTLTYYEYKLARPETFDISETYYYKTYIKSENPEANTKIYNLNEEKYFLPSEIKLFYDCELFNYYRKNEYQLQPLLDTIPVIYDIDEANPESKVYYITCQVSPTYPKGFKPVTLDSIKYTAKSDLFKKIEIDCEYDQWINQSNKTFNSAEKYYIRSESFSEITFNNNEEFLPHLNDYFLFDSNNNTYNKVTSSAIYDNTKQYWKANYELVEITEEEFKANKEIYYLKAKDYIFTPIINTVEENENWFIKEDCKQNEPFLFLTNDVNKTSWMDEVVAEDGSYPLKLLMSTTFIDNDSNEIIKYKTQLKNYLLDLEGKIDEAKNASFTYFSFLEENYDYYLFNENNQYWNKNVYEAPDLLNFWMDFLDSAGDLDQFSIVNIGNRSKVVNDKDVKSIYFRKVPEIIFVNPDNEKEVDASNVAHYTKIRNLPMNLFTISSQGKSAQDVLDDLLYNHSYCIESIVLQTIPIYYFEPNTRIIVYDEMSKINGEYLVSKISIPLVYNGMMTINATKAPVRLF